ncbi:hypothetical protein CPB85DRAFT_1243082 [Mucidula mucida]|nr:hypothetical protein CPB85DRAFT_1243082 [Mucidula mucida]
MFKYEILGLQQLFAVLQKAHNGVWIIIKHIEDAISGCYHVCAYTDTNFDLTIFFYKVSGAAAVYAANYAYIALLSFKTIQKYY